jgi:hypothetical protein
MQLSRRSFHLCQWNAGTGLNVHDELLDAIPGRWACRVMESAEQRQTLAAFEKK